MCATGIKLGKDWLKRLSKEHEGYVTQWFKPWTVPRVLAPRALATDPYSLCLQLYCCLHALTRTLFGLV